MEPDSDSLARHVGRAVAAVLADERRLRAEMVSASLGRLDGMLATPWFLPSEVRCEFRLVRDRFERHRFLWFRRSTVKPIADVRVSLGLAPLPVPPRAVGVTPALRFETPAFLATVGGDDALHLATDRGTIVAQWPSPETLRIRTPDGAIDSIAFDQGAVLGELRLTAVAMRWIVPLFDTLEAWRRGGSPSTARPFDVAAVSSLRDVIGAVTDGVREVMDSTDITPVEADSPLAPLAEHFGLVEGGASIRLFVGDDGSLLEDRDRGPDAAGDRMARAQQIDLRVRLSGGAADPAAVLGLDLPDFLVAGPVHERILRLLRVSDIATRVVRALRDAGFPLAAHADLADFLGDAAHRSTALVIRIDQELSAEASAGGVMRDLDLVVLDGRLGGRPVRLMLLLALELDEDPDRARVEDVDVLGWTFGAEDWTPGHGSRHVKHYLFRLLLLFHGFQQGVSPARAATGQR